VKARLRNWPSIFLKKVKKIFKSSVKITGLQAHTGTDDQPNMKQKYRVTDNGFRFVPFSSVRLILHRVLSLDSLD
jgi:hypothetical protein